ncbi:MAG: tRNA (adenosine(37)-N6)-dimethylallyltransferase MiaA [Candidatus Margulisiibacteriota bacterium]|nr:tRNA (adenosine(37)-N6)-dimethylallyltransferase MiaA [Candidatus Margulisiibacteriota bacterium]
MAAAKTIVILGPTAAGKTKLAIKLAKKLVREIISADSMQVYRRMDIGTAKPTKEERQGVPHHLIDIRNPDEEWTVSDFIDQTKQLISKPPQKIIVGGTGLYLWSLLEGYSFPLVEADPELRKRLSKEPLDKLYKKLQEVDPKAAEKIHANDKKRILRALEVFELTGVPISDQAKGSRTQGQRLEDYILIGLNLPRPELYRRIEERVDKMIEKGLIEEVKNLLAKGYSKDLKSFQALGYKEACKYLDEKWDKAKMIEELKKQTRHFARRQMTWFRRFKDVKWFDAPTCLPDRQVDTSAVLDYINDI